MRIFKKDKPMPVIVGSPRSGTTLVRLMLDAHPEMAVPPETGFLAISKELVESGSDREAFFKAVTNFPPDAPCWPDFKIKKEDFEKRLTEVDPFSVSDGLRLFYKMYAERFKKSRWGDKTPMYCREMEKIQAVLPESRFIHVIRDGRDVAVSLRKQWFSPGHDIEAQARFWMDNVLEAQKQSKKCRHYMEIRLEDLIENTRENLKKICTFLDLDFSGEMMEYYKRSESRLKEHEARLKTDGSVVVTKERRFNQQAATLNPPDKSTIDVWKEQLTLDDIEKFEKCAGKLLKELRYKLSGE